MELYVEGAEEPFISDRYDVDLNEGEPEAYHVQQPPHYHIYWHTKPAKEHRIRLVMKVGELNENNT